MISSLIELIYSTFSLLSGLFTALLPNIFQLIILLIIAVIAFVVLKRVFTRFFLHVVKKKQERDVYLQIYTYLFWFLVLVLILVFFSRDLTALGLSIGLLSAALGWALQKPITGIAAWLMLIIKKPFRIGDRVIIGSNKGDIADISVFYINLREVGGTVAGDESSGRDILIPTSIIFDMPIINYTFEDKYVLDEVTVSFTYESNLEKAEKIARESAEEATANFVEEARAKPFVRYIFTASGVDMKLRYYVVADQMQKFRHEITKTVWKKISAEKDVEFAYPHTEIVFKDKGVFGQDSGGSGRIQKKQKNSQSRIG
ncbi:MAG: mechanosensitive ion channel domain-containing protein [Candidatus Diapherotrites archaeon]